MSSTIARLNSSDWTCFAVTIARAKPAQGGQSGMGRWVATALIRRLHRQKSRQKPLRMSQGCTSMANRGVTLNSPCFRPNGGWAMKHSKRSFVVAALFAPLLLSSTGTVYARAAGLASLTFAAARTEKQQCLNACRARYRDCRSLGQIPSFECQGIYQDCTNNSCNAGRSGRPTWQGFPRS
jgi:hypothetical protein